jgi:transcriptional regulator with XRE-family HTH domain
VTPAVSLRRDLGQALAAARKAAGYTQHQLALATGYSRSTVSNAEIGHPDVARLFWVRCDKVLKSGRTYELAFEKIRTAERDQAAERPVTPPRAAPAGPAPGRRLLPASGAAEALASYQDLGWPATGGENTVELVTGEILDALELPRTAGLLAASLWLYSRGRPDDARRLPALPHPARSLAVIMAGDRSFFLAAAGGCPWPGPVAGYPGAGRETGREPDQADGTGQGAGRGADLEDGRVIRWHSGGSRIPAPPSRLPGGGQAAWAHLPSHPVQLAQPAALLGLLATASAGISDGPAGLTLPGGVRVLPPPRHDPASRPSGPHS